MLDTIPVTISCQTAPDRHLTPRPANTTPLPGFARRIGLSTADLAMFGGEVETDGRILRAFHRGATGDLTGVELIRGIAAFGFEGGGRKGLFRSPMVHGRPRLLIIDGPLPALCAAAVEAHRPDTIYAAPGGAWTAAAADAVAGLCANGVREVVLGFEPKPSGWRSAEAAAAFLRDLDDGLSLGILSPRSGTWVGALQRARLAG